jgi:hypothetical protein
MSYTTYEIIHTPYVDNDWDDNQSQPITAFRDLEVRKVRGDKRGSFKFKLTDFNNEVAFKYKANDRVTIRRAVNSESVPTDGSADLMIGTFKTPVFDSQEKARDVVLEGYDFSDAILGALIFIDAKTLDVALALKTATENTASASQAFKVEWDGSNPTTKENGSPFPVVGEQFYYKPFREVLDRLSQDTYTQDGRYYYLVTPDNKLLWNKESDAESFDFDPREDEHSQYKVSVDADGIRNFVIVRAGLDPENKSIQDRAVDYASINRYGYKYHILAENANLAMTIHTQDARSAGVEHMRDATFPFTASWISSVTASGTPLVRGEAPTFPSYDSGDDSYLEGFRLHVRGRARQLGEAYIKLRRYGALSIEVERPHGTGWKTGDVISVTIPEIQEGGIPAIKALRIDEVTYGMTHDKFFMKEDEASII